MRFTYEHLDWRELANRLAREGKMDELFRELMLAANGDVERALEYLGELSERYRTELGFDRDEFERHLRERQLISGKPGGRKLSARGERALRSGCLEAVFGKLKAHRRPDRSRRTAPRRATCSEPRSTTTRCTPGRVPTACCWRRRWSIS